MPSVWLGEDQQNGCIYELDDSVFAALALFLEQVRAHKFHNGECEEYYEYGDDFWFQEYLPMTCSRLGPPTLKVIVTDWLALRWKSARLPILEGSQRTNHCFELR